MPVIFAGIEVIFSNSDLATSFKLTHVRDVAWQNTYDKNVIINATNQQGQHTKTITVTGFILVPIPTQNTAAQQAFETGLRQIGTGTLSYTGITPVAPVRLVSVNFDAFRGNPTCFYTVVFETYADNPHTHVPSKIGNITLIPQPAVVDTLKAQAEDQRISNLKSRSFKFNGRCRGSLIEVNQFQANLIAEVEGKLTVVITLSTGLYTVRPGTLEFSSPEISDTGTARQYTFECSTYDNYSIEPYSFGEVPITYGNITIDVVSSFSHEATVERTGVPDAHYLSEESISVNGKVYFASYTQYQNYFNILSNAPASTNAVVQDTYTIVSVTGNKLHLESVDISGFKRDGNSVADDSIRYSASVNLSWVWRKGLETTTIGIGVVALGLTWFDIKSVNFGASVDEHAVVTSKSVSINGRLLTVEYNQALAKLGTKQDYDINLKDLYITSVNFSSVDEIISNGARDRIYDTSISANQLSSQDQFTHYLAGIFDVQRTDSTNFPHSPILFQTITSRSKSIQNRYDATEQKQIVTAISLSLSGEVHQADTGNGAPTNPTAIIALFDEIDESIKLSISVRGDILQRRWFLNSINVGGWERFSHPILKVPYWQQSVSISATASYEANAGGGGGGEETIIEAESYILNKQAPKFTTLQVLGYGTVFKRIGTEPLTATVTSERQYPTRESYVSPPAGNPPAPNIGNVPGFPGPADRLLLKETQEARGLTNRRVQEWTATKTV